jgi:two-component system, OmpR family, sensor histidine kinase KdpD
VTQIRIPDIAARSVGYASALAAVALVTAVLVLVVGRTELANVSMLYLAAVLTSAVAFGKGPAILASVAAFLTFNFFFTEPYFTLAIADPEQWIALLVFLTTAIVTGQLAATQRLRAEEARRREREAVVLYDVVRLMSQADVDRALHAVAERLRQELLLAAVAIDISDPRLGALRAQAGDDPALGLVTSRVLPGRFLAEGVEPSAGGRAGPGRWIRVVPPKPPVHHDGLASDRLYMVPVKLRERRAGTIFLVRAPNGPRFSPSDDRLLSAAADQLGFALERALLRREATEAEVLRRADDLKTALLNAISHDLRTPLASILTSAGSLLQEDVSWTVSDQREFAATIVEEAQRLNQIVGNLLDVSRIDAGALKPERGWYDVRALVDDVLGRLRPLIGQRNVVADIQPGLPPSYIDPVEIDQVLSNVIENALKYTPDTAEIRIGARRVEGALQVEVSDGGPGIPAAALPHLFDRFYRVNQEGARPRGTGLGLAVAKGLVEAHGGQIWAENRPEGGARFAFTLPDPEHVEEPRVAAQVSP